MEYVWVSPAVVKRLKAINLFIFNLIISNKAGRQLLSDLIERGQVRQVHFRLMLLEDALMHCLNEEFAQLAG